MNPFNSLCGGFGIFANLNTKLSLPSNRETILHYFDSMRKTVPQLTQMECRDNGEFTLEEDREKESHRWITLEAKRVCSSYMNPQTLEEADSYHSQVFRITPYHLDISSFDCEALDVVFSFEFPYSGNHDEVVAEALGTGSPLEGLLQMPKAKVLSFEPTIMLALDDSLDLQCRLQIETRTMPFQVKTGQFPDANLSVYFTIRKYWNHMGDLPFFESYMTQRETCAQLVEEQIAPNILKPLAQAIATRQ